MIVEGIDMKQAGRRKDVDEGPWVRHARMGFIAAAVALAGVSAVLATACGCRARWPAV